jgi:5-methylcytosine-specific restriction endonuclease McrA
MKRCSSKGECIHPEGSVLPATKEYFNEYKQGGKTQRQSKCRECQKQYWKDRNHTLSAKVSQEKYMRSPKYKIRLASRAEAIKQDTLRRERQLEGKRQSEKRYRERSPEIVRERKRLERSLHPEGGKVRTQRYKARKRSLSDVMKPDDWLHALEYWNGRCVYCNSQQGLWNPMCADHFVPVTDPRPDNPGTVPGNIVPACRSCNSSKGNRPADEWLIAKLGPTKGKAKLKEIQAYLDSRKDEAGK